MVPLDDLGEVCVHEQLLSLRFAFRIGTIYVQKEIFDDSGQISETVLQRKCRAPLLEECPQHHGHKGDPGVTPGTCGTIGERAQVILV